MASYRAKFFDEKYMVITRMINRDIAIKGTVLPKAGPKVVDGQYTLLFKSDLGREDISAMLNRIDPFAECEYLNGVTMQSYLKGEARF